ncbi:MAG: nicotinamide phosphoribosyltransferase domain-containing protein [Candidatus Absconditabacterales bacterium]
MNTIHQAQQYFHDQFSFPSWMTYDIFKNLSNKRERETVVTKNKILMTDTYNRTMAHMVGNDWKREEVFTLFLRKSKGAANVVYGIRNILQELLSTPITKAEVDFAQQAINDQGARGGNTYFNRDMRDHVLHEHQGYMPITIKAVADGTLVKPTEPVMTISGPGELVAWFEAMYLRIFYESCVATDAYYLSKIIGNRAIEFGNRSAVNQQMHHRGMEGCYVGGGYDKTSNDMTAVLRPQFKSSGTMAHRYVAKFPTEDEAFQNAIQKTQSIGLLIDLIDSISGLKKAIQLIKKYKDTDKIISVRLDSGNLSEQAVFFLTEMRKEGLLADRKGKVVVSDVSSIDAIKTVEQAVQQAGCKPEQYIVYGLGGLLIAKDKLRDSISAAFKMTQVDGKATGKLSNDPIKEPIPGYPNVQIMQNGTLAGGIRKVVQQSELSILDNPLLKTVYKNGTFHRTTDNDILALDEARQQVLRSEKQVGYTNSESPLTQTIRQQVRTQFQKQSIK